MFAYFIGIDSLLKVEQKSPLSIKTSCLSFVLFLSEFEICYTSRHYFLHKIDPILICKTVQNNTVRKGLFLTLKPSLETMPANDIPLNITICDLINNKIKFSDNSYLILK